MKISKSIVIVWLFILFILTIFFIFSYFIKVPNSISGHGTLVNNSVIEYLSKREGLISFFATEKKRIKKDQVLWVYESDGKVEDIEYIDNILNSFVRTNPESFIELKMRLDSIRNLNLGEVNNAYVDFLAQLQLYYSIHRNNPSSFEISKLDNKIKAIGENSQFDNILLRKANEKLFIAKEAFATDSVLFSQKLITIDEFNSSKLNFVQAKVGLQSILKEMNNNNSIRNGTRIEKLQVRTNMHLDEQVVFNKVIEKLMNIKNLLNEWKKFNVIKAPFDGMIKHYKFWKENDFVQKNENLFVFFSNDSSNEIEIKIRIEGAGKIKIGQTCLIELKEYPLKDFGLLQGTVSNIMSLKHEEKDNVFYSFLKINVTKKGMSSYGHLIQTSYNMPVDVEVILENERLSEKIFKRIRKQSAFVL